MKALYYWLCAIHGRNVTNVNHRPCCTEATLDGYWSPLGGAA